MEDGAFVGRTVEFAVLRDMAASAFERRRPETVVVVGAPGTAKSRLLREAARSVRTAHHFEVIGN